MSIKNTIARIIRSDFKQMQGNSSVQEIDTLLCHTSSEQLFKKDLPFGDETKAFQPKSCEEPRSSSGEKKQTPQFYGAFPELTALCLWLKMGANEGMGPERVWGWP